VKQNRDTYPEEHEVSLFSSMVNKGELMHNVKDQDPLLASDA